MWADLCEERCRESSRGGLIVSSSVFSLSSFHGPRLSSLLQMGAGGYHRLRTGDQEGRPFSCVSLFMLTLDWTANQIASDDSNSVIGLYVFWSTESVRTQFVGTWKQVKKFDLAEQSVCSMIVAGVNCTPTRRGAAGTW